MTATPAGLCDFINRCPSAYHVCNTVASQLSQAHYKEVSFTQPWPQTPGNYFVRRGATLIAWKTNDSTLKTPFRIIGAHTDSPNLKVKYHPDRTNSNTHSVALHPYGGAWLHSWLNRDLGISGKIFLNTGQSHLICIDEPILMIPQLAIHLASDRNALTVDPQNHLNALWYTGEQFTSFIQYIAEQINVPLTDIVSFDLMTHDLTPAHLVGLRQCFISAPRLDNQASCYAGLSAFLEAQPTYSIPVLALFNHEEVGSTSDQGAASGILMTVLERISLAAGLNREEFLCRLAPSVLASADMAHATHPNFPDKHEPAHHISLNGGPVIKHHPNLRYATNAYTTTVFIQACRQAQVEYQYYEHRADLSCGSTIGPLVGAATTIPTIDVGAPQLGMHAARELMGANDIATYTAALQAFLAPTSSLTKNCHEHS